MLLDICACWYYGEYLAAEFISNVAGLADCVSEFWFYENCMLWWEVVEVVILVGFWAEIGDNAGYLCDDEEGELID